MRARRKGLGFLNSMSQTFDLGNYHSLVFDFDGVFTDNHVFIDSNGNETVRCSRADSYALVLLDKFKRLKRLILDTYILSTETNGVVEARARKLSIKCYQGVGDKLEFLTKKLQAEIPGDPDPFRGLIYFGNDLNDLPVFLRAGFTLCPADAHEKIKSASSFVSSRNGGDHFVRQGVEYLLDLHKLTPEDISDIISHS